MKPLRLKPFAKYVAALEKAHALLVTHGLEGAAQLERNCILLVLTNPAVQDPDSLVFVTTHELVHFVHGHTNDFVGNLSEDEHRFLESEVDRLARLLVARPEWATLVSFWLNTMFIAEFVKEKLTDVAETGELVVSASPQRNHARSRGKVPGHGGE